MKAIVIDEFGGPEKMELRERPLPALAPDEVLVRIAYAGVNPVDWKIRDGLMQKIFPHRFPLTLGWDASGTIERVGRDVSPTRIGESVYAYCRQYGTPVERGTYAEYIAIPADMAVPAPRNLSAAQAAGLPLPLLTATQGLFDAGNLKEGETVLIPGAAGGVGGMAVQIARHAGARVIALASSANHEFVNSLGAHEALDYRHDNLKERLATLASGGADLLFDCVGGSYLSDGLALLRKGGRMVTIAGMPDEARAAELGVSARRIVATANPAQLRVAATLFESGVLQPLPVEQLSLRDVAVAHAKSKAGHVRGKIVLNTAGL
jgi:NADPH2:quinone reductase